jgi:hypothetical protein
MMYHAKIAHVPRLGSVRVAARVAKGASELKREHNGTTIETMNPQESAPSSIHPSLGLDPPPKTVGKQAYSDRQLHFTSSRATKSGFYPQDRENDGCAKERSPDFGEKNGRIWHFQLLGDSRRSVHTLATKHW